VALFLLTYGYNEGDERARRRDEHVAYLNKLHAEGSLAVAGPHEDGSGGAIVLRADDLAAAEAIVAEDPFTKNDVTRDRHLRQWKVTVGSV
jgi:uncharacterized protein YciI